MKKIKQKSSRFKSPKIQTSFDGKSLTSYAGLVPVMRFLNKINLADELNKIFPTERYSATKFSKVHIFMGLICASLSGINRLTKIAHFTHDALVSTLLGLKKGFNKDVIGKTLKELGQKGAVYFHEYFLKKSAEFLEESALEEITLDADSTVQTVYGNQEGAEKGFNSSKKGAKSYHPLLVFCSEIKLLVNTWFRSGNSYTANGILDFLNQTAEVLPAKIKKVFFRADSGFFGGELFDLLEEKGWDFLVKAKLNQVIKKAIQSAIWCQPDVKKEEWISEFNYKAKSWEKSRKLKIFRTIKEWKEVEMFGTFERVPIYQHAVYCSNLTEDAKGLHAKYVERATSENWIEETKNHLFAGKTLTNDFHANDILWMISSLSYNFSVMLRFSKQKIHWKEEHNTFRDWFIKVPALLVRGGNQLKLRLYSQYLFREKWERFERLI